jgi:hypothetical protein
MSSTFDASRVVMNFEAIRAQMADQGQRRAVLAGARVIGEAMVERTHVLAGKKKGSDSLEPGELKENIKVRALRDEGQWMGLAGPSGAAGKYGKVAYDVEYGHRMVTGGESRMGADGKFHGEGTALEEDVPAYPFLRPAFEASTMPALAAMAESLSGTLKGAVK